MSYHILSFPYHLKYEASVNIYNHPVVTERDWRGFHIWNDINYVTFSEFQCSGIVSKMV